MNPLGNNFLKGLYEPTSFKDVGLLQPANNFQKFYSYYWQKLYSVATNMFKWEFKKNDLFPTYFIEIMLNTQGTISFQEMMTRQSKNSPSQSLGYVFAGYVSMNGKYDLFGRPTKIKITPFVNANGTTTWQSFTVANSINTFKDEDNKDKAVIGYNTHLAEGLEWLELLCCKLAILETAKIDNVNLLKQPLTIIADEYNDFSADELVNEQSSMARVIKVFSGAGKELLDSLKVHSTGAENYIDTYQKQIEIELKEAYERLGISTNVVDKKERVLQNEQLTQNQISNLVYAEKYKMRLKFIEDITKVFGDMGITCEPILTLQGSEFEENKEIETEEENG